MLTITRKPSESFYIFPDDEISRNMTVSELFADGQIEITLNRIRGNQVSIIIEAPKELFIFRKELIDEKG